MQETARKGRPSGAALPSLVVCTPTRGLVHSRTIASVMEAVKRADVQLVDDWWKFAEYLPIPDAHNEAAEQAMATGAALILFVEDDNVLPPESVRRLMETLDETGAEVAAVNYPVGTRGTRWSSIYRENGEVLFSGLGITMLRREVFERLPRPWFSLDRWYGRVCESCHKVKGRCPDGRCRNPLCLAPCKCMGQGSDLRLIDHPFPKGTGGVDVAFALAVRNAGMKIVEVPRVVGAQLRITAAGGRSGGGDNESPHQVELWDTIDAEQRHFRVNDYDRFDIRQTFFTWQRGFQTDRWTTCFWLGDRMFGGTADKRKPYDAMHDPRIVLARDYFEFPARVLELGTFEGGHTAAISRWAEKVVSVEGREENIRKARWVLETMGATNAEVIQGNLEDLRLADLGTFDLVVAIGVLYHMPDPLKLIARCADAAPNLFLWTHVSPNEDRHTYQESGLVDPLSGLSETSTWLPKSELLAELRQRYEVVEVLDEWAPGDDEPARPMNTTMPSLTIAARGAR